MADTRGQTTDPVVLLTELHEGVYRFGFLQALRRLECAYRDKPRFAESTRAEDDPVRFGQEPTLAFAPSTLAALQYGKNGRPPRLLQYFFGVFGPNGPMPIHLTEYARQRQRNNSDETFARFADLFHHRLLGLFYRAWANAEPTVSYDRPEDDRFATYVGSLLGMGMPTLRNRDAMPDRAKLFFAGQLVAMTRNAEGLQALLLYFFKIPVRIEQFIGEWLDLPQESQLRLGESPLSGTLGVSATIGGQVWQCQNKFRIVFGPMNIRDYERLLPGSDSLDCLVSIVRNYCGDTFDWDVNLILRKEDVPPLKLGESGRLGWTSWAGARPQHEDAAELFLSPLALVA